MEPKYMKRRNRKMEFDRRNLPHNLRSQFFEHSAQQSPVSSRKQ